MSAFAESDASAKTQQEYDLEWIEVRKAIDALGDNDEPESYMGKKFKTLEENPLIPIGFAAIVASFYYGLSNFHDMRKTQIGMHCRIGAQFLTWLAIGYSAFYTMKKNVNDPRFLESIEEKPLSAIAAAVHKKPSSP